MNIFISCCSLERCINKLQAICIPYIPIERYASFIFLVMKNTECTGGLSIPRNQASYRYRHKQHVLSSVHNECLYNVLGQVHRIFILSNREPLKSWQTPYMHKLFATSKSHSNCNIRQIAEKALNVVSFACVTIFDCISLKQLRRYFHLIPC